MISRIRSRHVRRVEDVAEDPDREQDQAGKLIAARRTTAGPPAGCLPNGRMTAALPSRRPRTAAAARAPRKPRPSVLKPG